MKRAFIIISVVLLTIIIWIGESKATLQANPNTHYIKKDYLFNWMASIRNMEKIGGAMGLEETLNADMTPTESNNIDVHLVRSTEYGAVAILSASGYGNPQTLQESTIKTTTGNKTGVYFSGTNWELVSGGENGKTEGANVRYYDGYTNNKTSARMGDALGNANTTNPGCAGWHNSSMSVWIWSRNDSFKHFERGGGGLFSFNDNFQNIYLPENFRAARGVAVCGKGL